MQCLESLYKSLNEAIGSKKILQNQLEEAEMNLHTVEENAAAIERAQIFLQKIAKETQEKIQIHIQDIVQLAIDAVFPGEYIFQVLFEIKRGSTECQLFFYKDGDRINPMDSAGGGVVDITSFALRIACKTFSNTRNTIILDEPFRFLSQDLQPKGAEILAKISKKLHIQFIVVTHNDHIAEIADKIFENKLVGKISQV
jgi:DNA repair exonuclease SbcCD ATPase subunit